MCNPASRARLEFLIFPPFVLWFDFLAQLKGCFILEPLPRVCIWVLGHKNITPTALIVHRAAFTTPAPLDTPKTTAANVFSNQPFPDKHS